MCGFVGAINYQHNLLQAWNATSWRGNVYGAWQSDHCSMLSARLARSGDRLRPQPVVVNKRYVLSFNGEIYNIHELKRLVNSDKVCFEGNLSDTEALALILSSSQDKIEVIKMIDGEFALALYDQERNELILARDIMGTKPLFYSHNHNQVSFASSAKAVSLITNTGQVPDWLSIQHVFEFGVTPSANAFEGVYSVQPGEIIFFDNNLHSTRSSSNVIKHLGDTSILDQLATAVHNRYEPGKTALAFSGGVDSSLIKLVAPEIPCYTIVQKPEEPEKNQRTVLINEMNLLDHLKKLWNYIDRPFSTLSTVAMSILMEEMRKDGIENVLSGEGADEIFCGYPHYYKKSMGHPVLKRHKHSFEIAKKLSHIKLDQTASFFEPFTNSMAPSDWLKFDRWTRLPQHLTLLHTDCTSLVNQLEARLPFLDLVAFQVNDPGELSIPKKPLKDLLPIGSDQYRSKQGLFVPCGIFSDNLLLEICNQDFSCLQPQIPSYFREQCENNLKKIALLPETLAKELREILARTIIQVAALPTILYKTCKSAKIHYQYTSLSYDKEPLVCQQHP
ncbi:hypothetical protein AQ505_05985 [Pedobacter sp. PACM 27299]|uniref:asparagine synthetase B family protein n=1 Tax=Pedobacter sp. PACM 27299 TaxID=1727164 RepID=UPI0007068498|nr:asparagine synthetase B [Pedobacter sp. PACM 27299]ALL05084.1 hypothetical protein AQ505_05985 [Pedobacter sp. PACM 27299]